MKSSPGVLYNFFIYFLDDALFESALFDFFEYCDLFDFFEPLDRADFAELESSPSSSWSDSDEEVSVVSLILLPESLLSSLFSSAYFLGV